MFQKEKPTAAPSVIDYVDAAIAHALAQGASDIHFETTRQGLQLKFRHDGVMRIGRDLGGTLGQGWGDLHPPADQVISRIKVMAQLDITERRRPQDGRIRWEGPANKGLNSSIRLDLRVSIMPCLHGEDAVLRLLDKSQLRDTPEHATLSLAGLAFDAQRAGDIRRLAARPHGMLLVTGPTGSGKTTTVYAALSEVNDGLEKIITIEDPIEYELPGTLQIPVNEQKGLTFATGLRSILRHDPDKILVGEIRDAETAQIAVQSALTGHLVFTTVHANSLMDVLGRFQHFGIDPFGLASALNGVVVQRLMRQVCPHCVGTRSTTPEEQSATGLTTAAQAVGCVACHGTGYKGRFVVAEVHRLDTELRDLMVKRSSLGEMQAWMDRTPQHRLLAQAITLVTAGRTTIEEISRVIGWE